MRQSLFAIFLLLLCASWQAPVIPFKPSDDFHLELDFKFKQRPVNDPSVFNYSETKQENERKEHSSGPQPYLSINCKFLKLGDEEVRIRVINGKGDIVVSKKIDLNLLIRSTWGTPKI